eukprot:snap_masked-scaffold_24-processed-gene-5.14-mRNA-1 protein AED:0.11 eAED:0.13 QI:0/0/0/1/1/1/2/0/797
MALARRHILPPLKEPQYNSADIPYYTPNNSYLQKITSREHWLSILPELLSICNEASIRLIQKKRKINKNLAFESKALSLEYMADRLDLDEPLIGYCLRDKRTGWLQGFITVTTFTTWQQWFRWDSLTDESGMFLFEEPGKGLDALQELGFSEKHGVEWWNERKIDADGELAECLNSELRDGDPDDEGVVWPHVAEISLLGGLGCGKALVDMVLEELRNEECVYDYVVLQATENAVEFYEKMGFVRVGAVARYFHKGDGDGNLEVKFKERKSKIEWKRNVDERELEKIESFNEGEVVEGSSSAVEEKIGWSELSKKLEVDEKDLLFFNRRSFSGKVLVKGNLIRIPLYPKKYVRKKNISENWKTFGETKDIVKAENVKGKQTGLWYCSKDGENLHMISRKLKVDCLEFKEENLSRFPELRTGVKLVPGTVLRVPNVFPGDPERKKVLDQWGMFKRKEEMLKGDKVLRLTEPMCFRHWSFSDDPVDFTHASYMMAIKLKKKSLTQNIEVLNKTYEILPWNYEYYDQAFDVVKLVVKRGFERILLENFEEKKDWGEIDAKNLTQGKRKRKVVDKFNPLFTTQPPKKKVNGVHKIEPNKNITTRHVKIRFRSRGGKKIELNKVGILREKEIKICLKGVPLKTCFFGLIPETISWPEKPNLEKRWKDFFGKVVTVKPKVSDIQREKFFNSNKIHNQFSHLIKENRQKETDYKYYYVITYIPDLQYLRLAPMEKDGYFSNKHKYFSGQIKWKCVPETEGYEIDISANRCTVIQSLATLNSSDADSERWFIDNKETRILRKSLY